MAKRPSIKAAVDASRREPQAPAPKPAAAAPAARKTKSQKTAVAPAPAPTAVAAAQARKPRPASREGKVNISAFFLPEVRKSLRLVQAQTDANTTELLGEALNLLFQKYGVPACAPERDPN